MLEAVQLGKSGLRVSQLCLGTMNFGIPGRGHQGDWTLTLDEARPIVKAAIDHGLFYFDCADIYGLGASEEVVGALLKESCCHGMNTCWRPRLRCPWDTAPTKVVCRANTCVKGLMLVCSEPVMTTSTIW